MDLNKHYFDIEDIRVLRVISPEIYWITCSNCIPPDEVDQHMRAASIKTDSELVSVVSLPKPDDRVIVKGTDGIFLRGIVQSLDGSMCNVWLVDVCKDAKVEYTEMFINQLVLWRDLDSQAHLIGVSGLPDCSQPDPQLTKTCTQQINLEVEHLLQQFSNFHFSFSISNFCKANEIPYGNITLSKNELKLDWSKTLIDNGAFKPLDTDLNEVGLSHPIKKTFINKSGNASNAPTQIDNTMHVTNVLIEPKESIVALSKGLITDSKQIVQSSSKVQLIPLNHFYNDLPKSSVPISIQDNAPDEEDFKPIKILSPHSSCFDYLTQKNGIKKEFSHDEILNLGSVSEKDNMGKPQTVFRVGRCRPRLNNYGDPLTHSERGFGRGKYIKHLLTCQLNHNYAHERQVFLNGSIERQTPMVSDAIIIELPELVDSNINSAIDSGLNALEADINDPTPALTPQILKCATFNDSSTNNVDDDVPNAVLPGVTNYATDAFLFSDDEEISGEIETHEITGVDYIISASFERMKHSCALLHGYPQPKLASSFNALGLNQLIARTLRAMDIVVMAKCQIYSIPVQLAKKNLVLIGPAGTKKTTSYLLPLLSHLLDESSYSQLDPGYGPRGVIIVPNAQRVLYVADLCSCFCDNQLKVVATHGGGLELEKKDALSNGCDILVSTPRCWLRLLTYKHLTNIRRLCHIVFDSYDELSKLFHDELSEIYSKINSLEKFRQDNNLNNLEVQRVFVGKTWNKSFEQIVFQYLQNPVLCITAHLEAAIYAQVKLYFTVLKAEMKDQKLLEIIKENKIVRTVVVCNTPIEVKCLKKFLSCYSSNIIVAHEDQHHSFIQETIDAWQSNSDFLICSDQVLLELGITNAQWLINYSIPLSKAAFSDRFSLLQDNFSDRISNPKVEPSKCQAHLLVEDGNELQYPKLLSLVERSNAKVPDSLKGLSEKIKDTREKLRSDQPFCDKLLQFGQCRKIEICTKQHVIDSNRDTPTVPDHGYIIVRLIKITDASHYSARIVFTADTLNKDISESDWKPYPSQIAQINLIMSDHFATKQNWQIIRKPKIGKLVAVYDEINSMFLRAQIKVIHCTPPKDVVVWIIDDGGTLILKPEKLFKLPKAAQVIPPQTVSLYIANIQPFDLDLAWSRTATKLVKQKISDVDTNNANLFYISKVLMAIGSNMMVEDFYIYEKLPVLQCYLTRLSVKRIMLTQGLGLKSDIHVKNLKKLAIDAHMIQPDEEESLSDANIISNDKKWTHLPKDEFSRVFVSNCQNPHMFYVCQRDLQSKLDMLNADLKVALEKDQVKNLDLIELGTLCAVKINDQEWYRASVFNIIDDVEIEVLLLDVGLKIVKNISDVYEIPEDLITRLPFQAVECELEGVSPAKGVWCERGCAWFLSSLEDEEYPKTFELKVCDIKLAADLSGRPHYSVLLFFYSNLMTKVCLNAEIVNRGYANWNDQENNQEIVEGLLKELPDEKPLDVYLQDIEYLSNEDTSIQTLQNSQPEKNKGSEKSKIIYYDDDDDDRFSADGFDCVGFSKVCEEYLKSFTNANTELLSLDWKPQDSENNEVALNQTSDLLSLDWQPEDNDSNEVASNRTSNLLSLDSHPPDSENNELIPTHTLEYENNKNDTIVFNQDNMNIVVNGEKDSFSITEIKENRKISIIEESKDIEKDNLIMEECNNVSILENVGKDNVSVLEKVEERNVSIIEEREKDNVSIVEKGENDKPSIVEDEKDNLSSIEDENIEKYNVSVLEEGDSDKVSVLEEGVKDNISIPRDGDNNKEIVKRTNWDKNHNQFTSTPTIVTQDKNTSRDTNIFVDQKSPCILDNNEALEVSHLEPTINGDIKVPHLKPAIDKKKVPHLEPTDDEEVPHLDPAFDDNNVPHLVPAFPYLTPRVHWRQDSNYVWLKVLVPDISGFQINSVQDYIVLQAYAQQKLYWLDIDLFGPCKRKSLVYKKTGQYLEIKVEKLYKHFMWPRLTYLDTVAPHIKHDPDHDHLFYNIDNYDDVEDTGQFDDYESDSSSKNSSDVEELGPSPIDPIDLDF